MCRDCGCSVTPGNEHHHHGHHHEGGPKVVEVIQGLLSANDRQAAHNRSHFDAAGVLAINLMSSPGSGKTRLLEATIGRLRERYRIAVVEGDLETENDAARIRRQGVQAIQITTGTACHLDAHLVHRALHDLELADLDLLFVENVGNLVCPASFDLGQHLDVTLLSVTEGDDKPAKYPVMFRASDLTLITKTDLLPYMDDFDVERARGCLRDLAIEAPALELSARTGDGMEAWLAWLERHLEHATARSAAARG